ncbi:hypothetical protein BaRGS_00007495 [Batillaria attramentaria]|uniref:Uncharacterized protein n=1 Tax=Batillaria attramentaria TaxID=370345 RepID=A0ABD0LPJ2_9CAEN
MTPAPLSAGGRPVTEGRRSSQPAIWYQSSFVSVAETYQKEKSSTDSVPPGDRLLRLRHSQCQSGRGSPKLSEVCLMRPGGVPDLFEESRRLSSLAFGLCASLHAECSPLQFTGVTVIQVYTTGFEPVTEKHKIQSVGLHSMLRGNELFWDKT